MTRRRAPWLPWRRRCATRWAPAVAVRPAAALRSRDHGGAADAGQHRVFEQLLLPRLLPLLLAEAPRRRCARARHWGQLPKTWSAATATWPSPASLASLPEGFYQQMLFVDDFVCVVRRSPAGQKTLSLPTYSGPRSLADLDAGDLKGVVDVALAKSDGRGGWWRASLAS